MPVELSGETSSEGGAARPKVPLKIHPTINRHRQRQCNGRTKPNVATLSCIRVSEEWEGGAGWCAGCWMQGSFAPKGLSYLNSNRKLSHHGSQPSHICSCSIKLSGSTLVFESPVYSDTGNSCGPVGWTHTSFPLGSSR